MRRRRDATAEELRTLGEDLRGLAASLTRDPAEQARRERRWQLLHGGLSAVFALVARMLAARAWGVLTGQLPPGKTAVPPRRV
jgi:hypothetical protein